MKHLDEYRDAGIARALAARIRDRARRPWVLMEICGGQTHTILRYGLAALLPSQVELVHGPGCPVCVTPLETLDLAMELAARPGVILASFGDMLRVPGSRTDLFRVRAEGADVRVVYSPLDALEIARENPLREVVFLGVGFETTAPADAMSVWQARARGIANFSLLASHMLVPPAIRMILESPSNRVQGFVAPGHVCTVMGYAEYERLSSDFGVPVVVGGFEPVDLLEAILMLVDQLESGRAEAENQYARTVTRDGSESAQRLIHEVFDVADRNWRGLGIIPLSGLKLRGEFAPWDAERKFGTGAPGAAEPAVCIAAQVLQGLRKPHDCPAFGVDCTPEVPLGAPMVSSEGVCAAYYAYARHAAGTQA